MAAHRRAAERDPARGVLRHHRRGDLGAGAGVRRRVEERQAGRPGAQGSAPRAGGPGHQTAGNRGWPVMGATRYSYLFSLVRAVAARVAQPLPVAESALPQTSTFNSVMSLVIAVLAVTGVYLMSCWWWPFARCG